MTKNRELLPSYNPENGFPVERIAIELLTHQMLEAINFYASVMRKKWEKSYSLDQTTHPILVGYTFAVNQEEQVFEVYPVYEYDQLIMQGSQTISTGQRRLTAINHHGDGVTSWWVEEKQIFYFE